MAYIGRDIEYGVLEKETLTADSSTVAFDLAYSADANGLIVSVGGIVQEPNVAYTVVGNTLTFSTAPVTGDTVYVVYLGEELMVSIVKPLDYIDYQVGTGDGSDTTPIATLNHSVSLAQDIMVTLNGVRQVPGTDYSVSGTTLTFVTAPAAGVAILVYFLMLQRAEGEILDNSITDAKIVGMNASKLTGTVANNSVTNSNIVSMDASKLTGSLPSAYQPALYSQYQDLSTLALQWASVNNKVSMNLTDDFIDHFQDSTGVDSANSVNALVSSDEYVTSASELDTATNIAPSSNDWDYTFNTSDDWKPAGNSLGDHTDGGYFAATNSSTSGLSSLITLDGDFEIEWTMADPNQAAFGVHAINEDDSRSGSGVDACNMGAMTNSFYYRDETTDFYIGSSAQSDTMTFGDGSVIKIERVSGTIKVYDDGVVVHTYGTTYSGVMRFAAGTPGSPIEANFDNFKITDTSKVQRDGMFDASGLDASNIGAGASRKYRGTFFKATRTGKVTGLKVYVHNVNTAGTFHAEVWTHDGTSPGYQVGSNSDSINFNSTGAKNFTFTDPTIIKGQTYWMIVVDDGSTGAVEMRDYIPTPQYMGGGRVNDAATSLTDNSSFPMRIEVAVDTSAGEPTPDHDTLLLVQSDTTNGSTDFVDSSQNARTITAVGDAHHSTTQSKFGTSSMYFDGNGDYLSIPDSDEWAFPRDFTIECWVKTSTTPSLAAHLISKGNDNSVAEIEWKLRLNSSTGIPAFQLSDGSTLLNISATTAVNDNVWHHIAVVRNETRFDIYVDGISEVNTTYSGVVNNKTRTLAIGGGSDGLLLYTGWIDGVRISNAARWDADFTPPTAPYLTSTKSTVSATGSLISTASTADSTVSKATGVMLYKDSIGTNTIGTDLKAYFSADDGSNWTEAASYGSPTTFDGTTKVIPLGETTMSNTGTAVKLKAEWANQVATLPATGTTKDITPYGNANYSTSLVKIGSSSMSFDGSGDYLTVADSNEFDFGTNPYTIECWIKASSSNTTSSQIFSFGGFNGFFRLRNGKLQMRVGTGNSSQSDSTPSGTDIRDDTWHHVAAVRESATSLKVYLDGVLDHSGTVSSESVAVTGTSAIGAHPNTSEQLNAYLDEFRISNVARYTSSFTPSTTAFTSDANTVLLIHSNESSESTTFTDSSSNAHTITANGDTKHKPVVKKIGTSSLYCDGTGDLISVGDSDDFAFAGDYTVEFWSYFVGTPPNGEHCWGQGGNSASNFAFFCRSEGGGTFIFGTSNGSTQRLINPGIDLSDAWHHIAMVKSGTSQKLYIDGTQRGSVLTHSEPVQNVSAPWEFGGNSSQSSYIEAYFDEIRFSNTARYTANFTPSTTAFTTDANTKLLIHGDSSNPLTQVGQAVGTAIGNMTDAGGLASAFDGAKLNQGSTSNGARSTVDGAGTIGKDWGTSYDNTCGTGDRRSIITVTTDLNIQSGVVTSLVDGAIGTSNGWYPVANQNAAGKYIRFQLSYSKVINDVTFRTAAADGGLGIWKFQGSNDATTWTDLSGDVTLGNAITESFSLNNTTAYTYYQVVGVSGTPIDNWIYEFEFGEYTGVTKTISGVKWYGTSDGGLDHLTTLTLQGSTDNFSSSVVDLGYWTFTDSNNVITQKFSGFTTTTAYRYHRIKATASAGDVKCAELEFYEGDPIIDSSYAPEVIGKIAQLHGWAVNY